MKRLGGRLDVLAVRATSPDGNVNAVLRRPGQVELAIRECAYKRYDVDVLARQLRTTFVRLTSGWRQCQHEGMFAVPDGGLACSSARDESVHSFRIREAALHAEGASRDGRIRLAAVGLRRWRVAVAAGTVAAYSHEQFVAETQHAITEVWRCHRVGLYELQRRFGAAAPALAPIERADAVAR